MWGLGTTRRISNNHTERQASSPNSAANNNHRMLGRRRRPPWCRQGRRPAVGRALRASSCPVGSEDRAGKEPNCVRWTARERRDLSTRTKLGKHPSYSAL